MRKKLSIITTLFFSTLFLAKAQVTDPMITSWWFNTTNATYNGIKVNVEAVYYTTSKVYVKSSGVPSYYTDGNTMFNAIDNTNVFILPRTQTVATSATATYLRDQGNIAVFQDGSVAFSPCDGKTYNSAGVWHQIAYKFEVNDFDSYYGHSNPPGTYHHHVNSLALVSGYTSSVHSPLIGYAFDGYPIYGPYGYTTATSSTSGISRMKTSWKIRNITTRTTLPGGATASSAGPTIAAQALGKYFEDYEYSSGYGDLDQYNGRTCVTPEYPSGTYAYFTTIDASGNPEFPYFLGDYMYGVVQSGNMGLNAGNNTVATGATLYSSTVLPITLSRFSSKKEDCNVNLEWTIANQENFGTFEVEYSEDAQKFTKIGNIKFDLNKNNYAFSHQPNDGTAYYRLKMLDRDGSFEYSNIISERVFCDLDKIKINVFPNPFTSHFVVDFPTNSAHKIIVYDAKKAIIYNNTSDQKTEIDLSSQSAGMYVVEIIDMQTGNGLMRKIVKQ